MNNLQFKLNRLRLKAERPKISVILLNWNRLYLLQKTLESIIEDLWLPYEFFVVDNASTDGSTDYIVDWCDQDPRRKSIVMDENIGGKALNTAFEQINGKYIYISENDFDYLDNWLENLLLPFYSFKELGQLSPFSPFSESDEGEVWEDKPAELVEKAGTKIYIAEANVGTSCMLRRDIIDKGVQFDNIPHDTDSKFQLPNDLDFSNQIKALGYKVAWSEKYNVKNWGHNIDEFENNPDYYVENYRAKPLGKEGLFKRIDEHGYKSEEDKEGKVIITK